MGFGGYGRLSAQLWLLVRWHSAGAEPWTVDTGWLLWGEHVSRLSQVNTRLQDVINQQRKGAYLQISKKIQPTLERWSPVHAGPEWTNRMFVG